ncbi:zinc finger domain-containing protein, partial [Geobacillus stearothermophilus]|uniref:zinc finger domain-containing protein n=1 Tax=Geobacillus stearothermophilus TaxID=1422 RepID=UPI002E1ED850
DAFMNVRDDILQALENARNEKVIGKSLTASVTVYPKDEARKLLASLNADLRQLLIVSAFSVADEPYDAAPAEAERLDHVAVLVRPAEGETCERCWTVTPAVGQDPSHPTLCPRCAHIVNEHYSA